MFEPCLSDYVMSRLPYESGSCREDSALADHLQGKSQREDLFRNISSAAESGWDFSSRWCSDDHDLASIRTTDIIPIDLNVYIWNMESVASKLSNHVGDADTARVVRTLAVVASPCTGVHGIQTANGSWYAVVTASCYQSRKH